jgi:hypothetical protein
LKGRRTDNAAYEADEAKDEAKDSGKKKRLNCAARGLACRLIG